MTSLFIAPLPQPVNGQSKASQAVLEAIEPFSEEITIVNLSKTSLKNGTYSTTRVKQLLQIFKKIWTNRKNNDVIYFSLSESTWGNIKDFIVYLICHQSLNKMFVHMLGGAGMKTILEKDNFLSRINIYIFRKLKGIIVEGSLNHELFSNYVPAEKIHIIPNFVDDSLITDIELVSEKFNNLDTLNILYLSNLIPGKGYLELVKAFIGLDKKLKNNVRLTFVGGFESKENENDFLNLIRDQNDITYLGSFIDGEQKRILYLNTHIFCLPTYYPFEGQPISILETYATGCYVITTNHSGIPYIFTNKVNGLEVEKKSIESLRLGLAQVLNNRLDLLPIALYNATSAKTLYTKSLFQERIKNVLLSSNATVSYGGNNF